MALAVCLLFDARGERAVRDLWRRVEDSGVPTLLSHTHGRHVPHLSYAVLRTFDVEAVHAAVGALPHAGPVCVHLEGVGAFIRGRTWLVPAVSSELARRQEQVVTATLETGADLHRHYRPGRWLPHVSLAPRARLADLPRVAGAAYSVLPLTLCAVRVALVDTSTGRQWPLPTVP